MAVQPGLCRTWSETPKTCFLALGSYLNEDKSNYLGYEPSEDSDQSDQSPLCAQWVANGLIFLHGDSEDSDRSDQSPLCAQWVANGLIFLHGESGD